MRLRGKHAVVTGGTDGIGLEIARRMKRGGASVTVVGRRQEALARSTAEGMNAIQADLSSAEGCFFLVAALRDQVIDVLVNNAGADPVFKVGVTPDLDAIDSAVFLNLNAPIHLIAGLLDGLRARPQATVVNVTSGLAIAPSADTPVYCGTKAGLRSFTMALRAQLAGSNVTVIEALPPLVDTAMTRAVPPRGKMSSARCAGAIVDAVERDQSEVYIGQTAILRRIYGISPRLARKMMLSI